MGRMEADRDDWMQEATALRPRGELALPDQPHSWFVGFRGAAVSIYCGPDEVYHFSPAGALRRAYRESRLWKAERHRLVALTKVRTPAAVQLAREELDAASQAQFLQGMEERLQTLQGALQQHTLRLVAEVPADGGLRNRLADWLTALPKPVPVAASVRG